MDVPLGDISWVPFITITYKYTYTLELMIEGALLKYMELLKKYTIFSFNKMKRVIEGHLRLLFNKDENANIYAVRGKKI